MPHLRALVERHKDDPFVLIGISVKDSEAEIRKGREEFSATWRMVHQPPGTSPISNLFKVTGYPTYFVIGPDGKILSVGHDGEALDKLVAKQIQAIKSQEEAKKEEAKKKESSKEGAEEPKKSLGNWPR